MTTQLPIGARVCILSGCYKDRIGYIEGDNSFDIWLAQKCGGIVPPYYYHYHVITPDGEDIEHGYAEPHELRVTYKQEEETMPRKNESKSAPKCDQCGGTGRTIIRYGKKYGQYEKCEGCNGSGRAW